MKLSTAVLACLPRRELQAAIDYGGLSKAEIATINGLRADGGRHGADVARGKLQTAIRKQFAERDRMLATARTLIKAYAQKRVQELMPMPTRTELQIAKAADEISLLRKAVAANQASHPGRTRADALQAVLESPEVSKYYQAEVNKLGINRNDGTLPQQRTADIDFGSPGVHGRTGYDRSVDGRPPHNPDSGENPIIRDHHQTLDDIKSGKLLWNDPKVSALVALERKQIFEKNY